MRATAKKRTIGTMKRGLEVTGAAYGEAVALKVELENNSSMSLRERVLINLFTHVVSVL